MSRSSGVRNMVVEFSPHNQNFILTIVKNTKSVTLFCGYGPPTDFLVYIQKNRKIYSQYCLIIIENVLEISL